MPEKSTYHCRRCLRDLPRSAFDDYYFPNGKRRGIKCSCRDCHGKPPRKRTNYPPPNPSGLCMCGCGQPTKIATGTHGKGGLVAGQPKRYTAGHSSRRPKKVSFDHPENNYVVDPVMGCHVWKFGCNSYGYGQIWVKGKFLRAHIWYYEQKHGPIPDGWEHHHECQNKRCVNPAHIKPMPDTEHGLLHHPKGIYCRPKLERWANHFDSCIDCGGTDRPHEAHGRCRRCYQRVNWPSRRRAA